MKIRYLLVICILAASLTVSCARTPSNKTSGHLIHKYFHKYGHKYKTTDFGTNQIGSVEVLDVQEIHKHLVTVVAEVRLVSGPTHTVKCMLIKKPFGWKMDSWENVQ